MLSDREATASEPRPRLSVPVILRDPWRAAFLNGIGALLGILLAFGINAWWSNRADRVREATYLQALRSELEVSRSDLLAHIEQLQGRSGAVQHYLRAVVATSPNEAEPDSIHRMVSQLGPYRDFVPRRAALDDLLSSGGLQLIRSDTLRRALAAYEQALSLDGAAQDGANALSRMQQSPYDVEHANLLHMLPYLDMDPVEAGRFPMIDFPLDPAAYYQNRRYSNLLMSRYFYEERVRDSHGRVLVTIEALLRLLDGEDGSAPR